jgi:hypothetical protein
MAGPGADIPTPTIRVTNNVKDLAGKTWLGWSDSKSTRFTCARQLLTHPDADTTIRELAQQVLDSRGDEGVRIRSEAFDRMLRHIGEEPNWMRGEE